MSNEPNKPIMAQELTDKELEGIVGGRDNMGGSGDQEATKVVAAEVDGASK